MKIGFFFCSRLFLKIVEKYDFFLATASLRDVQFFFQF